MKKAIHIYLSTFENESRILKQTKSIIDHKIVDQVIVLARGKEGLPEFENISPGRSVVRVRSEFMKDKIPLRGFGKITLLLKMMDSVLKFYKIIKKEKPLFINLHQVALLPLIPIFKLASRKSKFIYDAHELETETNGLAGNRKNIYKKIESKFIKSFVQVFVVSPSIEKWYRDKYGIKNIATVMNCPIYKSSIKNNLFREEFGISNESRIYLYQGALFKGRGIEILLDAFAEINDPKYTLICMGYGEFESEIKEYAKKYKNIFFKTAVSPDVVLNFTSSADVGISMIENVCLSYYYCLPNKLFEYLMAEIPCIVSDMPEMRNYINKYNTGVVCKGTDKQSLINSILEMDNFDYQRFQQEVEKCKVVFSWETQEKVMINEYRNLLLNHA
ncbi:glycosyltransferase [Pedobacter flavus]|uniref:Glycosyltransferase n=1 Tax=Pedobacter flavus TaxID=3113906 RepID=A0ABU7H057_9SPHI|nr:glycosyltransferase [Pedobacter sp. VNH31]MEE1884711.1 glycosyltransferase [Pedobacter sp. VNH31]